MDLSNFTWYHFRFDLPEELLASLQRNILLPFTTLIGERGEQEVAVVGHVEPCIRKQIISAMTP